MATAKVIIKGENQISGAVRGAKNDLSGFSQAAQKVGETLKKAFAITAVVASLKKLGDACSAYFNDFSQANRAYKQLSLAMKDQSAYKSVIANIDRLLFLLFVCNAEPLTRRASNNKRDCRENSFKVSTYPSKVVLRSQPIHA